MRRLIAAFALLLILSASSSALAGEMLNVYLNKADMLAHKTPSSDIRIRPEEAVRIIRHSLWPWDESGSAFSLFVELENTIEGLVRLSSMDDDYYVYHERSLCLIGERTKKMYRVGDKVKVQLIKSSVEARQIDFMLIDEGENEENKKKV